MAKLGNVSSWVLANIARATGRRQTFPLAARPFGTFIIFFASIFFFALSARADTSVTGTVDRNQLRPGDTFTFSVAVDSSSSVEISQPRWPDFTGFEVINSWTGNEVQSVFENGRFLTKRRQTFNLQVQAQQVGKFTINAAEVVVDGQSFRTRPVTIEVVNSPAQNPRGNPGQGGGSTQQIPGMPDEDEINSLDDMFNQMLQDRLQRFRGGGGGRGQDIPRGQTRNDLSADELFFVDVEVDKIKVYEGEQVLASYYLYTRGRITDIDTLKYPNLVGFWKEDIELATRLNFQPVVINGIQYNRALLAAYALFPIKAGTSEVDSYSAQCTVANMNPFGLSSPKVATKDSPPVKIQVLPVPAEGKPADYAGAVGQFGVETKVDTTSPKVNQPVNITIRFAGRGNGKLIELPKAQMPNGVDIYDSKSEAKFFKDGRSYKEFQVLVIPRQAGPVEIPPFAISLFDPEKKSYYRLQSDKITLNVQPGDAEDQVASSPLAAAGGEPTVSRAKTFPPLMMSFDADVRRLPLIPLWSGLYLAALAFLTWVSRRELGWGQKRETLRRLVQRRVTKLNELAKSGEWRKAASAAMNLVYFVLGEISGIGGGSQQLNKMLAKAPPSFRNEFQVPLEKLVSELELVAFAPEEVLGQLKEPEQIRRRLNDLEKLLLAALAQDFDESLKDLEG